LNGISVATEENATTGEEQQEESKKQSDNESRDQWINAHKFLSHLSTQVTPKEWLDSLQDEQRGKTALFNLRESPDPSPPIPTGESTTTDLSGSGNHAVSEPSRKLDGYGMTSIPIPPKIATFPSYKGQAVASHVPLEIGEDDAGSPDTV
jgi:hypothetical protein